jgi:hypothetical protein
MSTVIENPGDGHAYSYDFQRDACEMWNFTSKINGFPLVYPTLIHDGVHTVDGVASDKFTNTNDPTRIYDYAVYFKKDSNVPIAVYNSDAEKQGIVGGLHHITNFDTTVPDKTFEVKKEWSCTPKAVEAVVLLEAADATVSVPNMPSQYQMDITWSMKAGGKVYDYLHHRFYDVGNQLYRDDEHRGSSVMSTVIENPGDGHAYSYDFQRDACEMWNFTAKINGFPLVYPTLVHAGVQVVDGVKCDKFTNTNDPTRIYDYAVFFKQGTNVPVAVYNSDAAKQAIVGGMHHITNFDTNVPDKTFDVKTEWSCTPQNAEELALLESYHPVAPSLPSQYQMDITWQMEAAGKVYDYHHHRFYDLTAQKYRDDEMSGASLKSTTIEVPGEGHAYRYDQTISQCQKWNFTSEIDGFPLSYPALEYLGLKRVDGVLCDTFGNLNDPQRTWDYKVWFKHRTNVPVATYNSEMVKQNIVGGMYHVKNFKTTFPKTTFDVQTEWGCDTTGNVVSLVANALTAGNVKLSDCGTNAEVKFNSLVASPPQAVKGQKLTMTTSGILNVPLQSDASFTFQVKASGIPVFSKTGTLKAPSKITIPLGLGTIDLAGLTFQAGPGQPGPISWGMDVTLGSGTPSGQYTFTVTGKDETTGAEFMCVAAQVPL